MCIAQSEVKWPLTWLLACEEMSSSFIYGDSEIKDSPAYSRKQKSLRVLCSNFLELYSRDGVELIQLDDAASQLGVERRRMYDIINILESVGVLTRKGKNEYTWKGLSAIPRALEVLKEEALQEKFKAPIQGNALSEDNNHNQLLNSRTDGRKGKSLFLLAKNFVKLFICSDVALISVDQVSSTLLADTCDPTSMKTRFRRLYDITNVFVTINLIDKVSHPDSGKPAFKWIGGQGHRKLGSPIAPNVHESKKRVFGSDITHTSSKRCKVDCSSGRKLTEKENVNCALNQNIKYNSGQSDSSLDQEQKRAYKNFVFGPFKPSSMLKMGASKNKNAEKMEVPENLASLNQGP